MRWRVIPCPEQPLGPHEHHDDEEHERHDVTPLDVEQEPAHRDELGEDECGHEAADHVPQAAEHADEERDRAEGQPDRGVDVVLQYEEAGPQPRERPADRRCDDDRSRPGLTPISGMIWRSWLIARIAVPR